MNDSTASDDQIYVKSHVARDLLQNAALFKTDRLVVWEYVSNGLEYIDEGTSPIVKVTLDSRKKRLVVEDNGRGMDWDGLHNFFVMHGENIERKQGKPGRGRFGTGKSAAFGIAGILRITTVRSGLRSKVELRRNDIEAMNSEDPIPVRTIEREEATSQSNGTVVEVEHIHFKPLNQAGIIQYIERHLAKWRNATVLVNNYECEFTEPAVSETRVFTPEGRQKNIIGDVELIVKIASTPLDQELRGVSIYSNGIWYETTLAGNDGRDMSQYIFGEIDVPRLDADKSPTPPFDLSRSMRLNPSNELVQNIYAFIGSKIDLVRRQLVKSERERKKSEEGRRLDRQAEAIAEIINNDFDEFRQRIARVKAKRAKGFDIHGSEQKGDTGDDDLILGSDEPAKIIDEIGGPGSYGGEASGGKEPRMLGPIVEPASQDAKKQGKRAGGKGRRYTTRGGFSVQFRSMGENEVRALYVSDERKIYVNTDHPQLVAARGSNSVDDALFLRLAYEVAFSEYAIALAAELNANDEYMDPAEPIIEIRSTVNRISRKAAHLYSLQE